MFTVIEIESNIENGTSSTFRKFAILAKKKSQ